jgi:hypothetical protein
MRFKDVLVTTALSMTWVEAGSAQQDLANEGYYTSPILIQIAGPEETVWENRHGQPAPLGNECQWHDTPDQPAIAIRDHLGRINIFGGGFNGSFKMVGTNFSVNPAVPGSLTRVCHSIFTAGFNLPGGWVYQNFRNHDWVTGIVVDEEKGNLVYALLQAEFWGSQSPYWGSYCGANCPPTANIVSPCWVNAVTAGRSFDGGDSFKRGGFEFIPSEENYEDAHSQVVAKIMDTYRPCEGRAGYLNPTNIVRVKDPSTEAIRFRAMIEADGTESKELSQQRDGMCVIQCGAMTYNGSIVPDGKWRAFAGHAQGFNRNLAEGDIAPVVGERQLAGMRVKSLFRLSDLDLYIGLGTQTDTTTGNISIYFALSKDLVKWHSKTKVLDSGSQTTMEGVTLYPSLINHGGDAHNLSEGKTSEQEIHLYLVRRTAPTSQSQVNRKLARMRVKIAVLE